MTYLKGGLPVENKIKLAPVYKVRRGECCGGCLHWQGDPKTPITARYGTCVEPTTHVYDRYRPWAAAVCRKYQFSRTEAPAETIDEVVR